MSSAETIAGAREPDGGAELPTSITALAESLASDVSTWDSSVYRWLWFFHYQFLSRSIVSSLADTGERRQAKYPGVRVSGEFLTALSIPRQWGDETTSRLCVLRVAALLAYGEAISATSIFGDDYPERNRWPTHRGEADLDPITRTAVEKKPSREDKFRVITEAAISLIRDNFLNPRPEDLLGYARRGIPDDFDQSLLEPYMDEREPFVAAKPNTRWLSPPKGKASVHPAHHARVRALVDAVGYDATAGAWMPRAVDSFPAKPYLRTPDNWDRDSPWRKPGLLREWADEDLGPLLSKVTLYLTGYGDRELGGTQLVQAGASVLVQDATNTHQGAASKNARIPAEESYVGQVRLTIESELTRDGHEATAILERASEELANMDEPRSCRILSELCSTVADGNQLEANTVGLAALAELDVNSQHVAFLLLLGALNRARSRLSADATPLLDDGLMS